MIIALPMTTLLINYYQKYVIKTKASPKPEAASSPSEGGEA